jgi:exopolysaccharide production protein ExoQ
MTPLAAAIVCVGFVVYLFRRDVRVDPDASTALWVPLLWMFFASSRYVSSWLSLGAPGSSESYNEGSPVDAAVFFALITMGISILAKRDIAWGRLVRQNKLFVLYLLYCLVSLSWSDEPFIGFKRWFKDLGNPIVALVILTDRMPMEAIGTLLRRLAFMLLPLSVVFIKYYPGLGRGYKADGSPMYTGVGHQKNALGQMCLVAGIYFAWQVLENRKRFGTWTRETRMLLWVLTGMLVWLLYMSNSQTSLSSLLVVVAVLAVARLPFTRRSPSRLAAVVVCGALLGLGMDGLFDLRDTILGMLGRKGDLTYRTDMWATLLELSPDPLFGAGFMSFWAGERLDLVWNRVGAVVLQAHSGYIEQYLNLGYVGVAFMVALIVRGLFRRSSLERTDVSLGILRLCFIFAAAVYNYTEAVFYGVSSMWVLFLIGVLDVPDRSSEDELILSKRAREEEQERITTGMDIGLAEGSMARSASGRA